MEYPDVDPALWPLVEGFPPIELGSETLEGFRAAMAAMSVMPDPASHADVGIEEVRLPGPDRQSQAIRCLLYRPREPARAGSLLHVHGGGYVMGAPEMDVARNVAL